MPSDFYVLMIKNTSAERKSHWDNHKSFHSTTSITTVAETFVVIPGTYPSAGVFFLIKKPKNRLASVFFVKINLTITPLYISVYLSFSIRRDRHLVRTFVHQYNHAHDQITV